MAVTRRVNKLLWFHSWHSSRSIIVSGQIKLCTCTYSVVRYVIRVGGKNAGNSDVYVFMWSVALVISAAAPVVARERDIP